MPSLLPGVECDFPSEVNPRWASMIVVLGREMYGNIWKRSFPNIRDLIYTPSVNRLGLRAIP